MLARERTVDEGLKKRLIGVTVLVSLVVIFVPMLLQNEPVMEKGIDRTNVPPRPEGEFTSRILPLESEQLSLPKERVTPLRRDDPPATGAGTSPGKVPGQSPQSKAPAEAVKPRVGLTAWVIQVGSFSKKENAENLVNGSFSKKENAENLVNTLRQKDFSAFMEQAEIGGKQVFRVRVGPVVDHGQAEKMLVGLNRELKPMKLKGALKRYP